MAKKRDNNTIPNVRNEPRTESELNTAGAARRRLLRTLMASGGTAVGGLLAAKWTKPVINTAILPAHAQATMIVAPACFIAALVDIIPAGSSVPYTAVIVARDTNFVSTTLANSVIAGGESTQVTGEISTLGSGVYSAIFAVSFASAVDWAFTFTATCCSDSGAIGSAPGSAVTSFGIGQQVTLLDDGSCSVP